MPIDRILTPRDRGDAAGRCCMKTRCEWGGVRRRYPAENRVRRDDACFLTHDPPAEFLASHRASAALGVGQATRSLTQVLPEDALLLPERVEAIFLVAIHPASQGQPEEGQSVGHGLRLRGSDTAVTHVVSGIHSPPPFSRTIRPRPTSVVSHRQVRILSVGIVRASDDSCNNAPSSRGSCRCWRRPISSRAQRSGSTRRRSKRTLPGGASCDATRARRIRSF